MIGVAPRAGELRVYPVPANDWLRVDLPGKWVGQVQLMNMHGQLAATGFAGLVDVSELPSGVYFLEAETEVGTHRQLVTVR